MTEIRNINECVVNFDTGENYNHTHIEEIETKSSDNFNKEINLNTSPSFNEGERILNTCDTDRSKSSFIKPRLAVSHKLSNIYY
jgi:hypothetical protein